MKRIIFSLPEELFVALQRVAKEEQRSVAAVLRDAAQLKVSGSRPVPRSIGIARSGEKNLGRRATEEQFVADPFR